MAHARACGCGQTAACHRRLAHFGGDLYRVGPGLPRQADLARLKKGLAARNTEIVPVTPAVSQRASALIDELALSHGMRLADALIGATAIELQATLLTANLKH
jgi:predicted nucleic acid-binding protein